MFLFKKNRHSKKTIETSWVLNFFFSTFISSTLRDGQGFLFFLYVICFYDKKTPSNSKAKSNHPLCRFTLFAYMVPDASWHVTRPKGISRESPLKSAGFVWRGYRPKASGQISSRPHTTWAPKWWFSRDIPLFQGNLGWWNIIPFGQKSMANEPQVSQDEPVGPQAGI